MLDILQLELGGTPVNTTLLSHSSTTLKPPVLALHVEAGEDVPGGGGDGDDHLLRHPTLLQVPDEHSLIRNLVDCCLNLAELAGYTRYLLST